LPSSVCLMMRPRAQVRLGLCLVGQVVLMVICCVPSSNAERSSLPDLPENPSRPAFR
jgi:hypothetical protein